MKKPTVSSAADAQGAWMRELCCIKGISRFCEGGLTYGERLG